MSVEHIISRIKQLELESLKLEPNRAQRLAWEQKVQDYAQGFLDKVHDTKAYIAGGEKDHTLYDFGIPEQGRSIDTIIEKIADQVDHYGINPASGGHFGYIPGGGVYPTALGDYLADVFNRYSGIFYASPGAVKMENLLIRWMNNFIGYPESALGNLTSGGSVANLIGIVTARDSKGITPDLIARSCVYATEQVHHSLTKALRIAGLETTNLRRVHMDERFRMDVTHLRALVEQDVEAGLKPFLVLGSAGTTDVGAVDPLNKIADVSEQFNLWFHVDGAYGGFFALSETVRPLFAGIERSDSVSIDPHKGLFLSYGSGAVLIRDVEAAMNTHHYMANYMQDVIDNSSEPSPADLSPELTRHFRGLRMWLPLQLFGVEAFKACVDEKVWLARYFYIEIQKHGFEVGPEPDLSVVTYRFVPENSGANGFNERLTRAVQNQGDIFISSTMIGNQFWLRLAIVSFRSHKEHVDRAIDILATTKNRLLEI